MQNQPTDAEFVHVINPEKGSPTEVGSDLSGYGLRLEEVDPRSPGCLARCSVNPVTGRKGYFVKFSTAGPDAGHMYNHLSMNFEPATSRRVSKSTGRPQYEFRSVVPAAFEHYLNFLKTENIVSLRHAERAL